MFTAAAVRPCRINFMRSYPIKRDQGRRDQSGGHEKYGTTCQIIAASPHSGGGKATPNRGKGCIATQSLGNRISTDETETNRRYRRPQHSAGDRMHEPGSKDHGENRPCCDRKCASADRNDG